MTSLLLPQSPRLRQASITAEVPIAEAVARLDAAAIGALVVCDTDGRLAGLLTDGDVRRAMLQGIDFETPCRRIMNRDPVQAPPGVTPEDALRLLDRGREFLLDHLPVVDAEGRVVDLILRSDLVREAPLALSAVIMAGGFGTRMRPLTNETPKPMLPVGGRPLLARTIEQLREAGIHRVGITTHYLAERITSYFGDGSAFGVELRYIAEDRPLGTAGALRLLGQQDEPFLVINGDILTGVHFRDMLGFHRANHAEATVGVRKYEFQVPYGVIDCEEAAVRALREKPRLTFLVNAGIYLLEPTVQRYIPPADHFDMTDLIQRMLDAGRPIVSFPIMEYWMDIGQPADYERAQEVARQASR